MNGLLTDGQFIGAVSAQAVTSAPVTKGKHEKPKGGKHRKLPGPAPVQTEGWEPGDTAKASGLLGKLGLKGPEPKHAKDTAGKIAGGFRTALGRVLVEGKQAVADADDMARGLAAAAADKAKAAAAALDQIVAAVGQAAYDWYLGLGVEYVEWVTDSANSCPVCQANEDEGPVKLGEPFESGDEEAPIHPHCRCAVLPAAGWDVPQDPAQPEPEPAAPAGPVAEAQALADAYYAAHEEGARLLGGQSGAPVTRVTLSDGTQAVVKSGQEPSEALHGYLAGLVARALGIDGTQTALIGDETTVSPLLSGVTGAELRAAAGESPADRKAAELQRIAQLGNGREIGLLDFLTANADRNDGNYLVDGNTVRPVDHAFANFQELGPPGDGPEVMSPFANYWLAPDQNIAARDIVPLDALRNPYTSDELAGIRSNLEALQGEFSNRGAAGEYRFMTGRLAMLEQAK